MKKLSRNFMIKIASELEVINNLIEYNGNPEIRFEIDRGIDKGKILLINPDGIYCFENKEDCENDENPVFECEFDRVI